MKKTKHNFTVTGPEFEVPYLEIGPALSRSVTEASKAGPREEPVTFYVRDREGDIVGRSETDAEGVTRTWRLA
jgi:hypothetical protein